jgi:putative membrane protein
MIEPPTWAPYCGPAPLPDEWLGRWNLDPLVIAGLIAAMLLLWRFRPAGRAAAPAAGALALLALIFVSPLCALTSALFSARVAHHLLLTGVVAPLLVAAVAGGIHGVAGRRAIGSPSLWVAVHALLFWLWHAPAAYQWALSSDLAYWLMQASLLGSAFGLWASLRAASAPSAVAALLATMLQMGLLGALLTFASVPLYAPHWLTTGAWGLTPLADQQLAGLIMWVPGALIYLGSAMWVMWRWIGDDRRLAA